MIARILCAALLCVAPALAAGDAAKGRELFRSCQSCHNTTTDDRKTGPSLRTLFGKVTLRNGKRVDDDNVREIVREGFNGMPSFGYSFRAAEIDDLMAYLHTLTGKPAEPDAGQGAAYFRAYCVRCHNPDSRAAPGPDLRGRFTQEMERTVEEGHAGAAPLKDWLGEKPRRILFDYLHTL